MENLEIAMDQLNDHQNWFLNGNVECWNDTDDA
jgi:hypothetical protein